MKPRCQHAATRYTLVVLALGVACRLPTLHAAAAETVVPPKMFSGILRDDLGNPVAGATIKASNVGGLYCGFVQVRSPEATTDERGRFSLQTGFYPVYVVVRSETGTIRYPQNPYSGYRRIPLPLLRQPEHDLVLMRWAKVTGNVVDRKTGKPVTEFRVHFHSLRSHMPRSCRSKDGSFEQARVPPGENTITILAEGYAPTVIHAVALSPGSKTDIGVIRMTRGRTLRGRVLRARDGQPLAGATIRFRDTLTHAVVSYPPDELTATTDADGRFSVPNMPLLVLELYTSIEKPEHRSLTIGQVDMALAQDGIVYGLFFVEVEGEHSPHAH